MYHSIIIYYHQKEKYYNYERYHLRVNVISFLASTNVVHFQIFNRNNDKMIKCPQSISKVLTKSYLMAQHLVLAF